MYRSSPLHSTLNTSYIRFGYVSVSSMYRSTRCDTKCKKKSPKAKTRPGKKGTKARKGCVSGSANVPVCGVYIYSYIYIYHIQYIHVYIVSFFQGTHIESKSVHLYHSGWWLFPYYQTTYITWRKATSTRMLSRCRLIGN